jgi:WD40 repeat protein
MPRPERPLDSSGGPVETLAGQLRGLRRAAGNPGYRELATRCEFSMTVLADAAGGRRLPSLPVTLAFVRACGGDPVEWERRWSAAAAECAAWRSGDDEAPYLGLRAYGTADAHRFFGRDELVAQLLSTLERRRFVAVFGASGSGKSSLLRAGLIPALDDSVLLTPGADPVAALRQVADSPGCVVVVDQFEELFTLCREPAARDKFVDELTAMAGRVVIGVRSDFFPRCVELPALARLLTEATVPVAPLTTDELRQVVTESARHAGLSVERALLAKVLADATGQPGAMPVLSHALLETWRQRRGDVLTLAGYEAAGGMATAIARTAEAVYQRLSAGQRETARRVLTRLVAVGDGLLDTRRRVDRRELDFPGVDAVLRELADARLVVLEQDTVEIAHEALIEAWPRLSGWLNADRDALRLHRRLTEDTRVWQALGRDAGALYRGARLAAWDGDDGAGLNAAESAFLAASRQRAADEVAGRRRRTRLALTALATTMVLVSALAAVALAQGSRARDERDQAIAQRLMSEARAQREQDPLRALTLARQAYDTWPNVAAEMVLRQAVADDLLVGSVTGHQGHATGVAYSPDGRLMASTGTDHTVRVWSRRDGAVTAVLRGHADDVWSPVFSPDGRRVASAGRDGTVRIWPVDGSGAAVVLRGHSGGVSSVAFSPDGGRLASAGDDSTVRIWRADGTGTPTILRGHAGRAWGVAFSRDGRRLASSGYADRTVRIWDLVGQHAPVVLRGHDDLIKSLAFSPDGTRLASASQDGTARVWPTSGAGTPVVLRGHEGSVEAVAFSPDGAWLATASDDSTVRVWNPTGAEPAAHRNPRVLRGHRGTVWAVAFNPDGTELASAGEDGTVRMWDPRGPGDPLLLRGHAGAAWTVATTPDGRRVVSGGEDGTVRVWDVGHPGNALVLRGHDGDVPGLSVSRDGNLVASAGLDGTVRLWDLNEDRPPLVLRGHRNAAWMAALSPDGRYIASAGADGTLRIWDTRGTSPPLVRHADEAQIRYAAFSPDGRRVATAGADGTVRIWDTEGRADPLVLSGHQGLVWAVAFSADGTRLASAGSDGTARVWSLAGDRAPVVLTGHRGFAWHLAFSPDGAWLATTGHDDTVRLWRTDQAGESITYGGFVASAEHVAFATGGPRLVTTHGDGTVRAWLCRACLPIEQILAISENAG